jgi:hypothetical protein
MAKKTIKKVKKSIKPEFIVNLVDVEDTNDLYVRFALAKHNANIAMTDTELEAIVEHTMMNTVKALTDIASSLPRKEIEINGDEKIVFDAYGNVKVKKPNIFKRFWNWIRRK